MDLLYRTSSHSLIAVRSGLLIVDTIQVNIQCKLRHGVNNAMHAGDIIWKYLQIFTKQITIDFHLANGGVCIVKTIKKTNIKESLPYAFIQENKDENPLV